MKKLLLGSVAFLAYATAASAADMPVKAPPVVVPVPVATWTGCFIGGHFGGGIARAETTRVGVLNGTNYPYGTSYTEDKLGVIGGGQIGCDYQFASNWVIGAAGDFSWSGVDGDATDPSFVSPRVTAYHTDRLDWFTTATARLGWTSNDFMLYVKGGAAWTRDVSSSATYAGTTLTQVSDHTENRQGWVVGAGIEQRFLQNWSFTLEYDYLDFGTKTGDSVVSYSTSTVIPAGSILQRDVDLTAHLVKVGLNYRFNFFGAPVLARY